MARRLLNEVSVGEVARRWEITDGQRTVLESNYAANPFPDLASRKQLATDLSVTPRQVQVWFQNRRQKARAKKNAAIKKENGKDLDLEIARDSSPTPGDAADGPPSQPTSPTPTKMAPPGPVPSFGSSLSDLLRAAPQQSSLSAFGDLLSRGGALERPAGLPAGVPPAAPPAAPQLPAWVQKFPTPLGMNLLNQHVASMMANLPQDALSQLVRPSRPACSTRPIAKPPIRRLGLPMDRRSISMDALEVLTSQLPSAAK